MSTFDKYDPSYKKDTNATIAGVCLAILTFLSYIIPHDTTTGIIYLATVVVRIVTTNLTYNLAVRMNRTKAWAILGFFFPAITLIIMGQLRKLSSFYVEPGQRIN